MNSSTTDGYKENTQNNMTEASICYGFLSTLNCRLVTKCVFLYERKEDHGNKTTTKKTQSLRKYSKQMLTLFIGRSKRAQERNTMLKQSHLIFLNNSNKKSHAHDSVTITNLFWISSAVSQVQRPVHRHESAFKKPTTEWKVSTDFWEIDI